MTDMRKTLLILICILFPAIAFAQNTPVGKWRTIDDKTG
jgi:hypothetical protein